MKKLLLKLDLHDDKDKRKAMKIVSGLKGIDSISIDLKGKKMMLTGTVDPVTAVSKLRKFWQADIISLGPAKEPEKKEEPKKEEAKKEEGKKEEPKKDEPKKDEAKKEEPKKEEPKKEEEAKKEEPKKEEEKKEAEKKKEPEPPQQMVGFVPPYRPYYPPMNGVVPYNGVMPYTYRPYYPPPPTYYVQHTMDEVHENPNSCVIF